MVEQPRERSTADPDSEVPRQAAHRSLRESVVRYKGTPVGTRAACDPRFSGAFNSRECFVRDLVAACLRLGRRDPAERVFSAAASRCPDEGWPEYHDGRNGGLIGRFANLEQTRTAAAFLFSHQLLHRPELLERFPPTGDDEQLRPQQGHHRHRSRQVRPSRSRSSRATSGPQLPAR